MLRPSNSTGVRSIRSSLRNSWASSTTISTGVGGRFSVLTNVGLLPAVAIGLDIDAMKVVAAGINSLRAADRAIETILAYYSAFNRRDWDAMLKLLADAGWTYRDGALRNAQGQAMVIEYLDSKEGGAGLGFFYIFNSLTQFIVIPFMTDGAGADAIGDWFGRGADRGIALVFTMAGVGLGTALAVGAFAGIWGGPGWGGMLAAQSCADRLEDAARLLRRTFPRLGDQLLGIVELAREVFAMPARIGRSRAA